MTRPLLLLLISLTIFSPPTLGERALLLSTSTEAPFVTPDERGFLDRTIEVLFRRLGREARVVTYLRASERAFQLADQGLDDGLAMRIAGLQRHYPNLIQVPEPILVDDFVAITLTPRDDPRAAPAADFTTWEELLPHTVAYILGWKIFEFNLPPRQESTKVRDADQLFQLLRRGRADVILYERWQALARARTLAMRVKAHQPPLAQREMFIYLHRRHAALVEPAAAELRAMKADGSYRAIMDQTLTPLLADTLP